MASPDLAAAVLARSAHGLLAQAADPARAAAMRAYMRNQFAFFGVSAPARRALLKAWQASVAGRDALAVAEALWTFDERECQHAACDLLARNAKALPAESAARLAALVCARSWWDTVDPLASGVFGPLARRHPQVLAALDGYVEDENLWLRRVGLIYQLQYKDATDCARLERALDANLAHSDFFIRKAMGWALRQYARTDPEWVSRYLRSRGGRVPALTRREAARHL